MGPLYQVGAPIGERGTMASLGYISLQQPALPTELPSQLFGLS